MFCNSPCLLCNSPCLFNGMMSETNILVTAKTLPFEKEVSKKKQKKHSNNVPSNLFSTYVAKRRKNVTRWFHLRMACAIQRNS